MMLWIGRSGAKLGAAGLCARAAACLLFFQAIAFSCAPQAGAGFAGQAVLCAASEGSDDPAAPTHHVHGEHCLTCPNGGVTQPMRAVATIIAATIEPAAASPREWRRRDERPPPVSGWISSWSSQAPPFFS